MCELDFVVSDRVWWGLQRKFTLAEGHDKCDFRFKQPTSELLAGKG
jgi:hypothetical protein